MRSLQTAPDPVPPTLREGTAAPQRSDVVPRSPEAQHVGLGLNALLAREARVLETLADAAAQHVARGEREEALRTICDVVDLLEDVKDRLIATRAIVIVGESLVALGLYERAEPRLEEAVQLADRVGDRHLAARARRALGRAWLGLGDPSCHGILEDAGELFEDLGDAAAAAEIDKLLRIASSSIDPPRSLRAFHR
ncbi:MAG TPA: hypothetical protein VIF62_04295 [Labilithrix sp.]|jgi:hypothetical protein